MVAALLRFLALGALLVGLEQGWSELRRRPLDEDGGATAAGEEALYREALRRGYDRDDPVVQSRLVEVMRYLTPGDDAETLYRAALDLGIDRSDVVVRRRLVQRLRLEREAGVREGDITEAEVRQRYALRAAELGRPAAVRLTQIFLDRGRRGQRLEGDARSLLAAARQAGAPREDEHRAGDAVAVGGDARLWTHASLAKVHGTAFADEIFALPAGAWSQPIASPHGLHLVWVHERIAGEQPSFDAVAARLRREILEERRRGR